MGMQQVVEFEPGGVPDWASVRDLLASHGVEAPMRMIDGALSFPDEMPKPEWKEIRVAPPGGMITIRKTDRTVTLVAWGDADPSLAAGWNAVVWGFAKAGAGAIIGPGDSQSADDYRKTALMPESLR